MEGNVIGEIKSGVRKLDKDEQLRLKEMAAMAGEKVTITVDHVERQVEGALYVFTRPEGARANAALFEQAWKDKASKPEILRLRVFNARGESRTIASKEELPGLLRWLKE